ncbi:ATP-binding protein [Phormidium sp. CLA17]|uniref:ATP-binding protein n=1 Tax=Leptolyngbya sp. Cla-17 TaxID=2803751 RepID=UPI001492FEB2|nr:ATP-binding protein [Leptolyngbya sp. Cla-17]MBM0744541.1 ATP-binding protein [Leptolyngbya sp. Cla-17]
MVEAIPAGAATAVISHWTGQNYHYLLAAIEQVAAFLQPEALTTAPLEPLNPPAAIEQLCKLLGLSQFERSLLLLCAGMELHSEIAKLEIFPGQSITPTFSLALSRLPHAHWSATTPESPLRRWHLVELGDAPTLSHRPLRINERILHFLVGDNQLELQLLGLVTALPINPFPLPPSQQQLVTEIATLFQQASSPPLVQLSGADSAMKQAIAAAVCAELGYGLLDLTAELLPADFQQFRSIQTLWQREAILSRSLLLLDCDNMAEPTEAANPYPAQTSAIARMMEACQQPMFVFSRDRRSARQRSVFSFEVTQPTAIEQRQFWLQTLGAMLKTDDLTLSNQVDKLVSHFSLSPLAIQTICTQGLSGQVSHSTDPTLSNRLWRACLSHARPRLEELAQPIASQVGWDDLVMPLKEKQTLQAIVAQVKQRAKVYEQWGFGNKGQRGLGISALFAGASGTGKTLAAEVLATELQLDLYRIDLSSVVSKYIGETEKNLRRIFDAAETGGAILLFDEADALFGKRSEVKDSHDRYANMEVAYLLQRMEAYRGLAILTTNLRNSLDQAFLRRLRFVVQFPFPDAAQRAEIWQRVFPTLTPTENLSCSKLAKLNLPGGNIRNIALNAAFLAAESESPVQMQHILQAAQSEYIKLERPLTDAEIRGWV